MFNEYMKGIITEHSVGMQYVKLFVCINDDCYPEQKENYDKYAPMVANREELERTKMFYAITEAKAIEGSAVLMGSNSFTPTISSTTKETVVEIKEEKSAIEKWLKS